MEKDAVAMMLDGCVLGSVLANKFGLNARYFSQCKAESLNSNIKIFNFKNVLLVELPLDVRPYLRGYIATPLDVNDDESKYDYILSLTRKIKIGFWK
jgi:hypothetical protein